jgi:hypothetical protein
MATAPASVHANNFLAPEPHIVARLKELLPGVHVLTAADLAATKEESQPVPAVHVVWNGFRVLGSRVDGKVSNLAHEWLIVSAVRNVRGLKSGADARQEAGELAARAGAALMGYRLPNTSSFMSLSPSPRAGYSTAGYLYLPLAFQVESVFQNVEYFKGA